MDHDTEIQWYLIFGEASIQQYRHFKDLPYYCFQVKLIFNASAWGKLAIASKSLVTFPAFDFSVVSWGSFFNFKVNIVFANNKTMNYLCIYMELSFRSVPAELSSM